MNTTFGKGSLSLLGEVLGVSLKLGLTSFGGPIAHLGYFHHEYIHRRKWLDEKSYAELVALCQFLPGPASSQVGIGIGIIHAGLLGGLVAWLGFTLPSVIALVVFAFLLQHYVITDAGWIHGLKIVAVAIVAHAIWGMGQKLTPDRARITIAVLTAAAALAWQTPYSQAVLILLSGFVGVFLFRNKTIDPVPDVHIPISRSLGAVCLLAISVFTESLAAELAPLCITVNAIDPGPTDSGWMSEEVKKALLPRFPMGRIGLPEDAARLITFLASDDSQWITGQIIHSRGGF